MSTRRSREQGISSLETLYNSLTMDQLRTSLVRLTRKPPRSLSNKEEVIEAIEESGRTPEQIESVLLEVEAGSPVKHCLLMSSKDSISADSFSVGQVINSNSIRPCLVFKVVNVIDQDDLVITFQHSVEAVEWRADPNNPDVRRKEERVLRHPIFLHLNRENNLAMFFYPGFSQGSGIKSEQKLTYVDLLEEFTGSLWRDLGISFIPVPVEKSIKLLSDSESNKVKIVKTEFESGRGKMSLSAPTKDNQSVDEYLSDFISPYVEEEKHQQLKVAVREALKNTAPDTLAALWVDFNVVTRLKFWSFGAEFLFIWYGSNSSLYYMKKVFNLIVGISGGISKVSTEVMLKDVLSRTRDDVFTVANLVSGYSLGRDEVREVMTIAVGAGLIEPVYRLAVTEEVMGYKNDWTGKLDALAREFETENGEVIDGGDPRCIEVAFRKIREGAA